MFDAVRVVFIEDGSRDATVRRAARLVDRLGGRLVKLGPDRIRDRLHRTAKLSHLRRRMRAEAVDEEADWILMLDADIYFSLATMNALLASAARHDGHGLFTAYTYGMRRLFRVGRHLIARSRGIRERHYFDTFALDIDGIAQTFPHCPFAGCRKCHNNLIDPSAGADLPVRSAFGGLALIRRSVLLESLADWPLEVEPGRCEHIDFCDALARGGIPTYIVTNAHAYCDR